MKIAVATIHDDSIAMRGAVEALEEYGLFCLLGVFDNIADLTVPAVEQPAVLLIDPFSRTGLQNCGLGSVPKPYATLVMSAQTDADDVRRVLLAGARGFVSKSIDVITLINAINAVGYGGLYLGSTLDGMLVEPPEEVVEHPAPAGSLTPRERDVLAMIAEGLTHKQIGTKLNLSKATVDTYVHRMRQKFGSGNKADLTRLAINFRLLPGA